MAGRGLWVGLVAASVGILLSGCKVRSGEHGHGDDVQVATPFGGLHVKTDDSVQASVGLPLYPGAEAVKKGDGGDNGAADVNLSFGRFQLRVRALSYRTGDDTDTVKGFYKKALGRYGEVIECVGHKAVGSPVRTSEGLTCEENKGGHESNEFTGDLQLKAGSEHHQHIVGIEREGTGTKFGLVALDLPGGPLGDGGS